MNEGFFHLLSREAWEVVEHPFHPNPKQEKNGSIGQALEDEKPTSMNETKWSKIQKKVVSMIRIVLAPKKKYNVLKETTPKDLWEKLESIYKSKSLTIVYV
ncbi:Retrovirus-related Pol polyprotein from transposon TNT 1-94 [Glycine max]|nr:Retrovirus-related Pol polyprotein from transposon TNT 1-94 [Glycine max]